MRPAGHEEVGLFGGPERLFGCCHVPADPTGGAVVICASAPFDAAADEGRLARLGRRLAEGGVAAQRFHYRGTGSSDGDPAALGLSTMVDDARRALELLRDRAPHGSVGFVGARLGALVAARLARGLPDAPVAAWEPVVDPRAVLERALQTGGDHPGAELWDMPLAAELLDEACVGGLTDELGGSPRSLLLVQTTPGAGVRPEYEAFIARCRARHLTVDVACHPCDGERAGTPVPAGATDGLVAETAAWLVARLAPADGAAGSSGERAPLAADRTRL